ncbi:hypothetical protein ACFVMC_23110 [Nocardia sp. NPDC127579]|uniref:hypothetical protein n=1 Tax=Nocardia sp. NPDC127579 TaxID=3345402 RepID=UPI003634730F
MANTGRCPECGHDGTPILYGLPITKARVMAMLGHIRLGGCVVSADDPHWECGNCRHSWQDSAGAARALAAIFARPAGESGAARRIGG